MGRQRKFTPWLAGITALIALAILLFPVYAVIVGSFENNAQLLGTHYNFFPPTPTLANYRSVLSTQGSHIISSLIIGVATAILTLAIALPAAHALARYRFRVTVVVVASLLVAQILPSIVIANSPGPAPSLVLAQARVSSLHAVGVSEYAPALPPTKYRHASGRTSVASAVTVTGSGASGSPRPGVSSSRLPR